ncbi:3,4-dihydroxyphenylacetate 2,3-dioxygenase [Streptomyces fuscichromogenes]|uniref:3,4-dihydroxyphenylacetate 2,3-dioxygenase n=1 Tax=Streptomyces fuscichromogenes TaxID=1324013 RepID=A0A918CTI4_9ACTN|nr:3,4-dihydroxyphenylacetate 2,3-dioxygenase [Streptomyces fuscichromogenes]GGN22814.1 3,4-dihydroxyphenylacetate 2,3-dioxygenase [Streptomyces fuscichromogenes]
MGDIVLASKITHVPSIWLSLQEGRHHGIRRHAEEALTEVGRRARERRVDTLVVADTHWLNSSGFHLNAKARHEGTYASHELPHFIQGLRYSYPGDPQLAALIGEEIRSGGQKSLVHDIPELGLEYGTLVPMHIMNSAEPRIRVLPIGCNMYSTAEENIRVGEAVARAAGRSDRRVGFLASGSMSHQFPTNALTEAYLDRITSDFNAEMDHTVLTMWREGRIAEFLELLPDYNARCSGEGAMADTGMLFGVLGAADYHGRGEQLCDYFPSTGTGQVVVDFSLESAARR